MYHLCVLLSTFFLLCRNSEPKWFEPMDYLYRDEYMDYSTVWNYSKFPYYRNYRSAVTPLSPLPMEQSTWNPSTVPDPCCSHPHLDDSNGNYQ